MGADDGLKIYLNIITPAFMVRVLPKVLGEVVELEEMGEVEEFGEFLQKVSAEFPHGLPDTVPFEIGYENVERTASLKFQVQDGEHMSGRLLQYLRLWVGYHKNRVAILLRLAISLRGTVGNYTWSEADVEVGLPTGHTATFLIKVVEAVFVERAE